MGEQVGWRGVSRRHFIPILQGSRLPGEDRKASGGQLHGPCVGPVCHQGYKCRNRAEQLSNDTSGSTHTRMVSLLHASQPSW